MLQEMGGRESIEMVRGYAHLSADHLTEHASKIDAILERNGTKEECSLRKNLDRTRHAPTDAPNSP